MSRCQFCENQLLHSRATTCGSHECLAALRLRRHAVRENAPPPPPFYRRNCNRCDKAYEGPGRLLCNECRAFAHKAPPTFSESVSFGRHR